MNLFLLLNLSIVLPNGIRGLLVHCFFPFFCIKKVTQRESLFVLFQKLYTLLYHIFRFLTNLQLKIRKSKKSRKPAENQLVLSVDCF